MFFFIHMLWQSRIISWKIHKILVILVSPRKGAGRPDPLCFLLQGSAITKMPSFTASLGGGEEGSWKLSLYQVPGLSGWPVRLCRDYIAEILPTQRWTPGPSHPTKKGKQLVFTTEAALCVFQLWFGGLLNCQNILPTISILLHSLHHLFRPLPSLASRISRTEQPGGYSLYIGLQRVGQDWSDLACTHTPSLQVDRFSSGLGCQNSQKTINKLTNGKEKKYLPMGILHLLLSILKISTSHMKGNHC